MRWTLALKIVGDLFLINASIVLAFVIRFGFELPPVNWSAYTKVGPWITLAAYIIFYLYGLYTPGRRHWEDIYSSVLAAVGLLFIASLAMSFMLQQFAFPRSVLIIASPIQFLMLLTWRRFVWMWSLKKMGQLNIMIVGSHSSAEARAREIMSGSRGLYNVVGLVTDLPMLSGNDSSMFPLVGSYVQTAAALDNVSPNAVLICQDVPPEHRWVTIMEAMTRNISVFVIPDNYDSVLSQSRLEQIDGIPVLRLNSLSNVRPLPWKRVMDVVLALLFIIPAIPILIIASIAIKIESPNGPVLYRQERIGQGGKVFELLKLRTMIPDAEKETGPVLSTADDSRITKLGRLLRATRIDELPQLWNVLIGDMSFVGPRPERPFFVNQFRKEIPHYDYRHIIKPGITGLAQIEGRYSTSPRDKLRYDLIYAQNISFSTDLRIILHTIKVMLMRSKAS